MIALASVIITGKWLVPAAIICGVLAVLVSWEYFRGRARPSITIPAMLLKHTGIVLLVLCLLDPLWSRTLPQKGANIVAVLADNSMGLQVHDGGDAKTRGDHLRSALTGDGARWLDNLGQQFQVRSYIFDAGLRRTGDYEEMKFDGPSSTLIASLHTLADRFRGRPLASIILLSDGNATDLVDPSALDLKGLPPVYPVVIGSKRPPRDVAVGNVSVSASSFEDAPVTIQADVTTVGYLGSDIEARLIDEAGKIAAKQSQPAKPDGELMALRFQLKPAKPGLNFYRLEVHPAAEWNKPNSPEKPLKTDEATLANNTRTLVVDRGKGPHRVLYIAGRPNWEFKFLRRAVELDDQVALVGLIRIARKEPKFEWRGRTGEQSNPLFRGFDRKTEETERYDQPVLTRINTKDDAELRDGFPIGPELLYDYEAIIIDDLEAEFFTRDQMTLIQKFVSERGGGVLMLGGHESLANGRYEHTPVGDMLPVYLDGVPLDDEATNVRLNLTREGWLQPWVRLRDHEDAENQRLAEMPPFLSLNQVRGIKPGASVLAQVADPEGRKFPALVVQRYGAGRSAAMMVADLWHWGLADEARHTDMDKAWRQTVRWLIADVPSRLELRAEQQKDQPHTPVVLKAKVRDEKFQPLDNANVTFEVTPLGGKPVTLPADPAAAEAGVYTAVYVPRDTGGYRAKMTVKDPAGKPIGDADAGWATDVAADEFRSLSPNRDLMTAIAAQTGGQVIELADVASLASSLPNRDAPITQTVTEPLWHKPTVFLTAIACLIGEWGLRRWKGLP